MKKSLLFAGLGLTVIAAGIFYLRFQKTPPPPPPEVKVMDFIMKTPKEMKNPLNAPERERKALEDSLHGGVAFFADLYRLELAIIPEKKNYCFYVLFMDNYLAQPVFPNKTELSLVLSNDKELEISPIQNGVLLNVDLCPKSLPTKITIKGKLRGKTFQHPFVIPSYRKTPFNPQNPR